MSSKIRRTMLFGAISAGIVPILAFATLSLGSPSLDGARFSYAAPFTCGFDPDGAFSRIVPGQYATIQAAVDAARNHRGTAG